MGVAMVSLPRSQLGGESRSKHPILKALACTCGPVVSIPVLTENRSVRGRKVFLLLEEDRIA
jgi:hypothetical protein